MRKEYKGHEIGLDERTGKFEVVINGLYKKFASLKSAENAVDREAVVDFKPVDVLIINQKGYAPCTYTVNTVTLSGYKEEKSRYAVNGVNQYYTVKGHDDINIRHAEIYPVSALKRLTEICKERTAQQKIMSAAEKIDERLSDELENMIINLNPKP